MDNLTKQANQTDDGADNASVTNEFSSTTSVEEQSTSQDLLPLQQQVSPDEEQELTAKQTDTNVESQQKATKATTKQVSSTISEASSSKSFKGVTTRSRAKVTHCSDVQPQDSVSQSCRRKTKRSSHSRSRSSRARLTISSRTTSYKSTNLNSSQIEAILQSKHESQKKQSALQRDQLQKRLQREEALFAKQKQIEEEEIERKRQEILQKQQDEDRMIQIKLQTEEEERLQKRQAQEREFQRHKEELARKREYAEAELLLERQRDIEELEYRCRQHELEAEAAINEAAAVRGTNTKTTPDKQLTESINTNPQMVLDIKVPATQNSATGITAFPAIIDSYRSLLNCNTTSQSQPSNEPQIASTEYQVHTLITLIKCPFCVTSRQTPISPHMSKTTTFTHNCFTQQNNRLQNKTRIQFQQAICVLCCASADLLV